MDAVIIRDERGRFLPGTQVGQIITSENTAEYRRKRREKAAALIRRQIIEANNDPNSNMTQVISAAGGVANAAGALWSETVLNPDAYPRDRLDAWERISKAADVLSDSKQAEQTSITPAQLGAVAAGALVALRDMLTAYQARNADTELTRQAADADADE